MLVTMQTTTVLGKGCIDPEGESSKAKNQNTKTSLKWATKRLFSFSSSLPISSPPGLSRG